MFAPQVFWPTAFGIVFFVSGLFTNRRELLASSLRPLFSLGMIFVAASLATFGGEHLSAARGLAQMVPKFMPARLFISYLVGIALIAAGLSFVARKCVRWSSLLLAIMFLLFAFLLHWPNAVRFPRERIAWIVAVREPTFAMGGLSLFALQIKESSPRAFNRLVAIARFWAAGVIVFFGIENMLHPEVSPGVPDLTPTAPWVPGPLALAYVVGALLILLGIAMFSKYAKLATILVGALMTFLTLALYLPNFFLARGAAQQVTAINFVADTLLFAGTMLLIAHGVDSNEPRNLS